jgi:hypothetical protein
MIRSEIQKYADALDLDMHRLCDSMEKFADMIPSSIRSDHILQASGNLRFARTYVREFMHHADLEATK